MCSNRSDIGTNSSKSFKMKWNSLEIHTDSTFGLSNQAESMIDIYNVCSYQFSLCNKINIKQKIMKNT